MIPCEPGSVVLARFPFTDFSATKKRPVVVISPAGFSSSYGDVVVLALTSVDAQDDRFRIVDWREAGLIRPTWIKPLLGTVSADILERCMGRLSMQDEGGVAAALAGMISPAFRIGTAQD